MSTMQNFYDDQIKSDRNSLYFLISELSIDDILILDLEPWILW